VECAYVKSQDHSAYYVGFPRKNGADGGGREAVVKVFKSDGYAEWEEN
jgi:hypothetical protein